MRRDPGFYWVRGREDWKWSVWEWDGLHWFAPGFMERQEAPVYVGATVSRRPAGEDRCTRCMECGMAAHDVVCDCPAGRALSRRPAGEVRGDDDALLAAVTYLRASGWGSAADTITRLTAERDAARAERDSWKTVAMSNQATAQSHQERWARAEAGARKAYAILREDIGPKAEAVRAMDALCEALSTGEGET